MRGWLPYHCQCCLIIPLFCPFFCPFLPFFAPLCNLGVGSCCHLIAVNWCPQAPQALLVRGYQGLDVLSCAELCWAFFFSVLSWLHLIAASRVLSVISFNWSLNQLWGGHSIVGVMTMILKIIMMTTTMMMMRRMTAVKLHLISRLWTFGEKV